MNRLGTHDANTTHIIIPDIPPSYILDSDPWDSFYINQRYILEAFLQASSTSGSNVYISLYDIDENKMLLNIYQEVFNIDKNTLHVVWVPSGYYTLGEFVNGQSVDWLTYIRNHGTQLNHIQKQISIQLMRVLSHIIGEHPSHIEIRGYKPTRFLQQMKENLQRILSSKLLGTQICLTGYHDTEKNIVQSGKAFLHPDIEGDYLYPLSSKIKKHIPQGYRVPIHTKKFDILTRKFQRRNISEVIIKPIHASSGEGIEFCSVYQLHSFLKNYSFPMGDIIIEERINIQPLGNKISGFDAQDPLSVSVQFYNGKIQGDPLIQLTKDGDFTGALLASKQVVQTFGINEKTLQDIKNYATTVIQYLGLTGNGGLDFLFDKQGSFYFVDPNFGRDTGTLPLRIFEKITNGGTKVILQTKIDATRIISLEEFLETCREYGVNLFTMESKVGLFPISFVAGEHCSMMISGESLEDINKQLSLIEEIINQLPENKHKYEKTRTIISNDTLYDYDNLHS